MSQDESPDASTRLPLPLLQQQCQAAIDHFHRDHTRHPQTTSCDEIVRRAATGDADALNLLIALSYRKALSIATGPESEEPIIDCNSGLAIHLRRPS